MRRVPRVPYPMILEAGYASQIVAVPRIVRSLVEPVLRELPRLRGTRTDSPHGDLLSAARSMLDLAIDQRRVQSIARRWSGMVSRYGSVGFNRQISAALGVNPLRRDPDLSGILDLFVEDNVALIRTAAGADLDRIEAIVRSSYSSARRHEEIAEDIDDATIVGEANARRIARDQIGKLHGQLNAVRHRAAGLVRFTWRTSRDPRVRPEHAELEGRVFRFDDPPDDGKFGKVLPGEAIQCRCTAEPVFDDLFPDLDADETPLTAEFERESG